MHQVLICPGCGSQIVEGQQFCGVCGTKLASAAQQQSTTCSKCGSPISAGQQFCGVCGTKLSAGVQQPPVVVLEPETATTESVTPTEMEGTPSVIEDTSVTADAAPSGVVASPRKHVILSVYKVIFQVLGWIILVIGCLSSIAMGVFAGMGGAFMPVVPGMATIEGITVIGAAVGGVIVSLLYGFGFLALAELCHTVIAIEKGIR